MTRGARETTRTVTWPPKFSNTRRSVRVARPRWLDDSRGGVSLRRASLSHFDTSARVRGKIGRSSAISTSSRHRRLRSTQRPLSGQPSAADPRRLHLTSAYSVVSPDLVSALVASVARHRQEPRRASWSGSVEERTRYTYITSEQSDKLKKDWFFWKLLIKCSNPLKRNSEESSSGIEQESFGFSVPPGNDLDRVDLPRPSSVASRNFATPNRFASGDAINRSRRSIRLRRHLAPVIYDIVEDDLRCSRTSGSAEWVCAGGFDSRSRPRHLRRSGCVVCLITRVACFALCLRRECLCTCGCATNIGVPATVRGSGPEVAARLRRFQRSVSGKSFSSILVTRNIYFWDLTIFYGGAKFARQ